MTNPTTDAELRALRRVARAAEVIDRYKLRGDGPGIYFTITRTDAAGLHCALAALDRARKETE